MDDKYHFGCQLTADLIAMNTAGESMLSDVVFVFSRCDVRFLLSGAIAPSGTNSSVGSGTACMM